jgi:hypothetical protein
MMGKRRIRGLNRLVCVSAAAGFALLTSGCMSIPGHESGAPLVVTEDAAGSAEATPERAEAVAEIRAQAEASEALPFRDALQAEQAARLAAREEPRSVGEVQAIEAELLLIAKRRAAASDPAEVAALEARARELRRLAANQQPESLRP